MRTQIKTYDKDLTASGIVAGFQSSEFHRAWNEQGYFKIVINDNNDSAQYLALDKIVYFDEDKIGYIKKVTRDQKDNKGNQLRIVEGVELKDELRRVTYPTSGSATDSYTTEYVETIVKELIKKNAGVDVVNAKRQVEHLVTAADSAKGSQIDFSTRYKPLPNEIYKLLKPDLLGLQCTLDLATPYIIFDVVEGTDRSAVEGGSAGIVLSINLKTATAVLATEDKFNYKNLSITGGQGAGADRTILEVGETTLEGYERAEIFTDARDIESNTELEERGNQKIAETEVLKGKSLKFNNQGAFTVDESFTLGDTITTEIDGEFEDAQVIKIIYIQTGTNIPETNLVLDFDVLDTLVNDIKVNNDNYNNVVAKEYDSGSPNLDGGNPDSNFGGSDPIDGGGV